MSGAVMVRGGSAGIAAVAMACVLLLGFAGVPNTPSEPVRSALAPTGKLRVGLYTGSPTSIVKDAASGEVRGVSHDLGRELARRLGVAFEPVVFPNNAKLLDAAKAGDVDVVLTNATRTRAEFLDFTPTVLEVELGYLVPAGSRISRVADVDRLGIRVGVSQGSTSEGVLTRELKQAVVVAAGSIKAATEMLAGGKLDAFATNKAILFEMGDGLQGANVLEGRWRLEHIALGIPKGRGQALPYLEQFVAAVKQEGIVGRAVERAGLRGTVSPGDH